MRASYELPKPVFDHERCRCAALCIAVCPTQCLDLWNDRPWLKKPADCCSCGACVAACPSDAASFSGEVPFA